MIKDNNIRSALIIRAIDGDSVVATIKTLDLGEKTETITWGLRLTICNSPERKQVGYQEAKDFTAQFVDQEVQIHIYKVEKWGRILADIYVNYEGKQESLSSLLMQKGLAKLYGE